jgi:hypothetical protein
MEFLGGEIREKREIGKEEKIEELQEAALRRIGNNVSRKRRQVLKRRLGDFKKWREEMGLRDVWPASTKEVLIFTEKVAQEFGLSRAKDVMAAIRRHAIEKGLSTKDDPVLKSYWRTLEKERKELASRERVEPLPTSALKVFLDSSLSRLESDLKRRD